MFRFTGHHGAMHPALIHLVFIALVLAPGLAWCTPPSALCRNAIAAAERAGGVPDRLMHAIGVVESGRRDELGGMTAWPWTINAQGRGSYFNTKAEAVAAVTELRARGVRSIDVGCMQVNLMYHPDAFTSLDDAFDPASNTRYAARFLQSLFARTGTWQAAASGYHSLNAEFGGPYGRKVMAVWQSAPAIQAPPAQTFAQSPTPSQTASSQTAPPPTGLTAGAVPARIIPLPAMAAVGAAVTGRSLDSYRAMPTRLAFRVLPGRI